MPPDFHFVKQNAARDLAVAVDPRAPEHDRVAHRAAGDDHAARQQAVQRPPRAVARLVNELRGGTVGVDRAQRPRWIVEVKLWVDADQVHVGFVVRVDRADIAPVGVRAVIAGDWVFVKIVRVQMITVAQGFGQHVLTEIMARGIITPVQLEQLFQRFAVEDVIAHAGQRHVWSVWHRAGVFGFLLKLRDAVAVINLQHTEPRGFRHRHGICGDADIGAKVEVLLNHVIDVHFVDVITAKDRDQVRIVVFYQMQILIHRVGCTAVPDRAQLLEAVLLRGHEHDEVIG